MTREELDARLDIARAHPGIAHLVLVGPSPTCELCGGTDAPIVGGRHLNRAQWCGKPDPLGRPGVRIIDGEPRYSSEWL